MLQENYIRKQIFGKFLRPVLEDWLKSIKSPKSTFDTAINTSAEIIKRIPDFPGLMDKANYALQLMAEGKLNLGIETIKIRD